MTNPITASESFTESTFTVDDGDYCLSLTMATAAVKELLTRIEALEAEVQLLKGTSTADI